MDWKLKAHTPFLLSCFNILFWYGQNNNGDTSRFVFPMENGLSPPTFVDNWTGVDTYSFLFSSFSVVEMLIQKDRMSLHFYSRILYLLSSCNDPSLFCYELEAKNGRCGENKQNIVVLDQNYKLLNQEYWYDLNVLDTRNRRGCPGTLCKLVQSKLCIAN